MATAADIGSNARNYVGDVGLGGGSFGYGKLDINPLLDLGKYTMLYNKAEYERVQANKIKAAKELSDSLSYDLTTSIKKDADVLQNKYNGLVEFLRNNPTATDYNANPDLYIQYKTMRNDLENDLQGAKVRNLMNLQRQQEISDTLIPGVKSYWQDQLNQEIANTDIRTPLRHTSEFDIKPLTINAAPINKVQATEIGKNFFGQQSWELPDMRRLNQMASAASTGLDELTNFESQPWFKTMTPQEQAQVRLQNQAQLAAGTSGKLEPVKSAEFFNTALQNMVTQNPQLMETDAEGNKVYNWDALSKSNNKLVSDIVTQAQRYNDLMDQMTGWIKAGYFQDNFGGQLHFGNDTSGLQEGDFKKINLNDGVSPEELMKMRMLAITPSPTRTTKLEETDLGIKKAKLAQEWEQLGIEKEKLKQADTQSILGADAVLHTVQDAIRNGQGINAIYNDENRGFTRISDPNLIKEFASIDKEGNIVNRADDIVYDPVTKQIGLMYYKHKGKDDNYAIETADNKPGGAPIVDHITPLSANEWLTNIVGRNFDAQQKGAVNNFVNQIYKAYGNDLLKFAENYKGGETAPGPETKSSLEISTQTPAAKPVKGKFGKLIYLPE